MPMGFRLGLAALLSLAVPPLLLWAYDPLHQALSHSIGVESTRSFDLLAVIIVIGLGIIGVNLLPIHKLWRVAASLVYSAAAVWGLILFAVSNF